MNATEKARSIMFERKKQRVKSGDEDCKMCSTFGCGRKLSLTESLAGDKCINCQEQKPLISNRNLNWIVKNK